MIKVLLFPKDCWSLSELEKLSDEEKLEVAQFRGLSYAAPSFIGLKEFQQLFNEGEVGEVYVYFIDL